jgi:hypothetical protein
MFSQYNIEKQAWARQQDIARQPSLTYVTRKPAQAATVKARVAWALATLAPVAVVILLVIAR